MSETIRIANPYPGGAQYTTVKKARQYERSGRAWICEDGMLWFLPHASYTHEEIRQKQKEHESAYWWNGRDRRPWAMRRPGEVRS